MTLEDELRATFEKNEWTWSLKGGKVVVPSVWDIQAALDEAAKMLYDEPIGTQLEVGRLIIRKKHRGHDVFVYAGEYE